MCRLVSIKQPFNTSYNRKCNGLTERVNGVLKAMLKRIQEHPKDWDQYLPAILFAYREVPQVSTGFSPFRTVAWAHRVRGTMQVLNELWVGSDDPEIKAEGKTICCDGQPL